jgi:glycosyltransferase involved in cell wall biosynthesis
MKVREGVEKRIGFFVTSHSWHNLQRWHYSTAMALNDRGYEVVVITPKKSRLYTKLRRKGLEVIPFKKRNILLTDLYTLAGILKEYNIRTLFINYHQDLILAGLAKKFSNLEKLIFRRGTTSKIRTGIINNLVIRNTVNAVITNSEANKKNMLWKKKHALKKTPVDVVYQGINMDDISSKNAASMKSKYQNKLIIGISNCTQEPDYCMKLLKAIKKNVDESKYHFLIYQESDRALFQKKIESMKLDKLMTHQHTAKDIKTFMEQIDVYLSPVASESFNYPLIYAMAYGKPVLAMARGSNKEIIRHSTNGFLVDRNDFDSLMKALIKMRDENIRYKMGKEAQRTVKERFNFSHSIDQIESII